MFLELESRVRTNKNISISKVENPGLTSSVPRDAEDREDQAFTGWKFIADKFHGTKFDRTDFLTPLSIKKS